VDGYSSGFRSADNELSTGLMVPEVFYIIKNQISKLTEAIKLLIGIRGAWGGGEVSPVPYIRSWLLPSAPFPVYNSLFQLFESEVLTAFFNKLQAPK
jgi:hypothetical protein